MTCKGCSASVRHTAEEVKALVEEQLLFEEDLVDESIYQKRIEICQACPHLEYESTCKFCGCFVEFRTRLAHKRCPDLTGAKWDKVKLEA